MNKPNLTKKLTLFKETLRMLDDLDLREVPGGVSNAAACHSKLQVTACSACPSCTL
jgi:hypothetical protein